MARKLYVGNLPYNTAEQDLQESSDERKCPPERLFASIGTGRASCARTERSPRVQGRRPGPIRRIS